MRKELSTELVDSTFNEKPRSVKQAIILLVNVLRVDHKVQFEKEFSTDFEMQLFKNRLRERFKGYDPRIILAGYERAAAKNPDYMPRVQQIITSVEECDKEHKKSEAMRIEAERVSALPAPTITCDPVQMLADSKAKQNGLPTSAEMDAKIENHRALLIIHGDKIRSIKPTSEQLCKYGYF